MFHALYLNKIFRMRLALYLMYFIPKTTLDILLIVYLGPRRSSNPVVSNISASHGKTIRINESTIRTKPTNWLAIFDI